MRRQLNHRLRQLEGVPINEPILLYMPEGKTVALMGGEGRVRDLLSGVLRGDQTPDMDLLSCSIGSSEPGGSQLLGLARAILNSPR